MDTTTAPQPSPVAPPKNGSGVASGPTIGDRLGTAWDRLSGSYYPEALKNWNDVLNGSVNHLFGLKTPGETYGPSLDKFGANGGVRGMAADTAKLGLGVADFAQSPVGAAVGGIDAFTGGAAQPAISAAFAGTELAQEPGAISAAIQNPNHDTVQSALLHPAFAALMAGGSLHESAKIEAATRVQYLDKGKEPPPVTVTHEQPPQMADKPAQEPVGQPQSQPSQSTPTRPPEPGKSAPVASATPAPSAPTRPIQESALQRARRVLGDTDATITDKRDANVSLSQAQLSAEVKAPETPREIPRQLGNVIKTPLPQRLDPDRPIDTSITAPVEDAQPAEKQPSVPARPQRSVSPTQYPSDLQSAIRDATKYSKQLRRTDLSEEAKANYQDAFLTSRKQVATSLTSWAHDLGPKVGEAVDALKAKAAGLGREETHDPSNATPISYLAAAIKNYDVNKRVLEDVRGMRQGGGEGTRHYGPVMDDGSVLPPSPGIAHAGREMLNQLTGQRTADIGDVKAKAPSGDVPEYVQNAKDKLSDLKDQVEEINYGIANGMYNPDEIDDKMDEMREHLANMKDYEDIISKPHGKAAENYREPVKTVGAASKEQVAAQKGIPVADVKSTGTGQATDIKHGGMAWVNSAIWKNVYEGTKHVPSIDEMKAKLEELTTRRDQYEKFAEKLSQYEEWRSKQRGGVGDLRNDLVKRSQKIDADLSGLLKEVDKALGVSAESGGTQYSNKLVHEFARQGFGGDYGELLDHLEKKGIPNGTELVNDWVKRATDIQQRLEDYGRDRDAFHSMGVSGTKLLTAVSTGATAGLAIGSVVGGPIGGLVGMAGGAVAGGTLAGLSDHFKAAFPDAFARLNEWGREGSSSETLTPGMVTKADMRAVGGKAARDIAKSKEVLRSLSKQARKWSVQQSIDYLNASAHGTLKPGSPQEVLNHALDQQYMPRMSAIANLEHGSFDNWRTHYQAMYYEKPGAVKDWIQRSLGSKSPIAGSGSFRRQKVFDDVSEAMAAGYKPVTYNPVDLGLMKMREMDKYIAGHTMLTKFKDDGVAKFYPVGTDIPTGWGKVHDAIGDVYSKNDSGELVKRGSYWMPKDASKVFNNYVSPGIRDINEGIAKGVDILRTISNTQNQFELGLSGFHLTTTGFNAITSDLSKAFDNVTHGEPLEAGKAFLRSATLIGSQVKTYMDGRKVLSEYLSPKNLDAYSKTADAVERAGGRARMDEQYALGALDKFRDALAKRDAVGIARHGPLAGLELAAYPIMQHIVPIMKLGVFHNMAKDVFARAQSKGWDEMQTTRELDRSWDSVDNRMGQFTYDNVNMNKVVKEVGFAAVRSAGWTGGTIRELGGGGLDVARAVARIATGDNPELTRRAGYTIAMTLMAGYVGSLLHYAYNGTAPKKLKDAYQIPTGKVGADGRKEYVNIPSYMKDVNAAYYQPGETIANKASPAIQTGWQMLANRDYYGVEITHSDDPSVQKLKGEAEFILRQFKPFSVENLQQRTKGSLSTGVQSYFGITPAPRYASMSAAERELWYSNSRGPSETRTQAQFAKSQLKSQLEEGIRSHDNDQIQKVIQQSRTEGGTLTREDVLQTLQNSQKSYFQSSVERASLDDLAHLYSTDKPTPEERKVIQAELAKKFSNGFANRTTEQQHNIIRELQEGNNR